MMQNRIILKVENLSFKAGDHYILRNISFEMERGSFVGVIGPNGAGKSTLVKAIVGDLEGYMGEITVNGKIGYLPQQKEIDREFPITVREVAAMGLYLKRGLFKRYTREDWEQVKKALEAVGIAHLENRKIGVLSGGEHQRLMLARALLMEPDLLILDEPEAGVDEMGKASFYELLEELRNKRGISILMVSHDIGMVFDSCDKVMCLNRTLHCYKESDDISPDEIKRIFSMDFDILIRGKRHYHKEHDER